MSRKCDICGKGALVGYNVSHANNRTKKKSYPNLQKVTINGKKMKVCTRCLRTLRKKQVTG